MEGITNSGSALDLVFFEVLLRGVSEGSTDLLEFRINCSCAEPDMTGGGVNSSSPSLSTTQESLTEGFACRRAGVRSLTMMDLKTHSS